MPFLGGISSRSQGPVDISAGGVLGEGRRPKVMETGLRVPRKNTVWHAAPIIKPEKPVRVLSRRRYAVTPSAAIRCGSVDDDRSDRLALMHEIEALVDLVERESVSDHRVDLDFAVHVPLDNLRHVGAASCAAECGATPGAAGDELEGSRRDFLAGAGDTDDDALTPSFVRRFQRDAHHVDVADGLKCVITAAAG